MKVLLTIIASLLLCSVAMAGDDELEFQMNLNEWGYHLKYIEQELTPLDNVSTSKKVDWLTLIVLNPPIEDDYIVISFMGVAYLVDNSASRERIMHDLYVMWSEHKGDPYQDETDSIYGFFKVELL